MPTPEEQNVDWENGGMLRIDIGLKAIKFYSFPPPPQPLPTPHFFGFPPPPPHFSRFPPPPPQFYCFPSTTTTTTTYLLLYILRPLVSFFFSPPSRFSKILPTAILSSFCSNVSCSKQQSWFSSSVSWLPWSAPGSFKDSYSTTTSCTSPSLIQYTHGTHSHPTENKRILLPYKDALLNMARPNVPCKTKKRVLVQEGSGFIEGVLAPVVSSLGFLML